MASFIIVKTSKRSIDDKQVKRKIEQLTIYNDSSELRKGIKPETFVSYDDCVFFEFGFEYNWEYPTVEGTSYAKAYHPVKILFIAENFIAIEGISEDELSIVKRFLEDNFVPEIALEPIPFDDKVLRTVIDNARDVFEIEHAPQRKGMETIDRLKYAGRGGVTHSTIHEEYGDEPIARTKVDLREVAGETRVTFNQKGTVTIVQRSEAREIIPVLKVVVERIIKPYAVQATLQRRLY